MIDTDDRPPGPPPWFDLATALLLAAAVSLIFYAYLGGVGSGPNAGATITLTFLLVLPASVCAYISFVTDRRWDRGVLHHLMLPLLTLAVVLLCGFAFLGEGVICILMLAPVWLIGGLVGSLLAYWAKKRLRERGRIFAGTALLIPLMSAQIETEFPVPTEWRTVSRDIVVAATPEQIWPLLISIPAIRPDEGRWNVTQDLLGVPRPTSALLGFDARGGAVRRARWGTDIRFDERIVRIQPRRSVSWSFSFPDGSVRRHTDEHIAPDSPQLRIAYGDYRLEPAGDGRTRIRLSTRYRLRTPLNFYAAWWGERLLGDIQDNVLAIVRHRAERAARRGS